MVNGLAVVVVVGLDVHVTVSRCHSVPVLVLLGAWAFHAGCWRRIHRIQRLAGLSLSLASICKHPNEDIP